ncbi:MAG: transcriptional regulator GcvA [Pseudomonadota bacterium]
MQKKTPPLNALKAFEAAARLGSFKDAAEALNVSQSAVSHQVKNLEDFLGVELFIRRARSVTLTSAGSRYFPYIRDAFDHISEGTRLLTHNQQDHILTVQTYSTFAMRWLVPRLHAFSRRCPNVQVRLITAQNDPDFAAQDIDIAVIAGRRYGAEIHADYLFTPLLFPVCSPRLLESGPPLQRPTDLSRHKILQVYPSEKDWTAWLSAAGVESVDPNAGLSFDSYDHALKTAVRGLGVALAMAPYVSEDSAAGLLINPLPDCAKPRGADWRVAYPENRRRTRKIRAFKDWLISEIEADDDLAPLRRADGGADSDAKGDADQMDEIK